MIGLEVLHDILERSSGAIEDWFGCWFSKFPAVFNSSVDLRSSAYKVSPIDVNFYPAGYNNLSESSKARTITLLRENLSKYKGGRVLVVIEGHTRNKKYTDSVIVLKDMLDSAGFSTDVGICSANGNDEVAASCGGSICVSKLVNDGGRISTTTGFIPDVLVLNNDFTSGVPDVLAGKVLQEVLPSQHLGWFRRRKSTHFRTYSRMIEEFCREFHIDPWLISALFSHCDNVDFANSKGVESVAERVEDLISAIRDKYVLYGIRDAPYVFIKADNGTYGRGIISVCRGEDVLQINKRDRNKMRCVKEGVPIASVMLQEGIPTHESFNDQVAEPIVYYVGKDLAGYLYRYNALRNRFGNLNVPGCGFIDIEYSIPEEKKRVWSTISRLAVLAASVEAYEMTSGAK
ncbi:glutamate--cysteine ligase [Candidatus Anaplasma sp. TIGMIC]|uniref:glutamate--cysteine ligase n=1 Tax=Candidatus Anaplasma sp. TIGMIC TaxID=3020713 RepID=UPI00232CCB4B|nr:glutamate--cysteine ligase [Candidatus Anaplasma sp. TIGMIC]